MTRRGFQPPNLQPPGLLVVPDVVVQDKTAVETASTQTKPEIRGVEEKAVKLRYLLQSAEADIV